MKVSILLFLFVLTLLITDDVNAGKSFSYRARGYSRSSSSRHSSSRISWGGLWGTRGSSWGGSRSSSSGGRTTGSRPSGYGGHMTGSSPVARGSLSTRHKTGSSPDEHRISSGTYPKSQVGKPGFMTENKENSVSNNPYNPPPSNHVSKSTMVPSQSHVPTSFDQLSASFNPSHRTVPHSNPAWSNPHHNPSQSHPPTQPVSTNVGFKDPLRPTSMPVPSHVPSAPYPHTSYPSTFNQHLPSYPVHPSGYQPHSAYNPRHPFPSQPIGHPASYPAHVPSPVPGTFGNPYSTHPVGSAYGSTGPSYYPQQQHMLAQPAAQPYIPGQTVIMVPGQQDSGRGFGQMVKEALVFSTINAGVNRLLNPHHYYIPDSRPASSSTTTGETHITYNNHYFYGAPMNNIPTVPPSPNQGSVSSSAYYPSPVNNPVITPGVSIPTILGNNSSVANSANSSVGTTGITNGMGTSPAVLPNGYPASNTTNKSEQEMSDQWTNSNMPQYRISDGELLTLTEELFALQEFNVSKYLTLNLQNAAKSPKVTDVAKKLLIHVQSNVYNYPTILAIRALYKNYEHNSTVKENRTVAKQKEEDLLLDVFLNTNVMSKAMRWLSIRGFIDPDDFERKDILRHIWFSQFDGATSGFERVFTSERYGYDLLGVQDWIYFEYQESNGRIDYKGYVDILKLGNDASLVKLNFQMDDIIRPNATIFVGTLPELEMSLYTICFFTRPNDLCPISLGGSKFNIYTHSFRYYGEDLIDLALPIF